MKLYVGNLSYEVTEDDLKQAFEQCGQVDSVSIINDKYTGRSKGFGFVEMPSKDEAKAAIETLNGKEVKGRAVNVNEARPKTESLGGGRGGYGGGGGGRSEYGGGRGPGGYNKGGYGGGKGGRGRD